MRCEGHTREGAREGAQPPPPAGCLAGTRQGVGVGPPFARLSRVWASHQKKFRHFAFINPYTNMRVETPPRSPPFNPPGTMDTPVDFRTLFNRWASSPLDFVLEATFRVSRAPRARRMYSR